MSNYLKFLSSCYPYCSTCLNFTLNIRKNLLFFVNDFPELPTYYVWGIRWGILIFVVFAFEGFAMGSRMSHTVGLVNDNSNLFIVGWSKLAGDLRIAHFIGMHALQVLPLLAFYLLKGNEAVFIAGILYMLLATFTLLQALQGKPINSLFSSNFNSQSSKQ